MRRSGVLWTWGLLALGLTGIVLGTMMHWYEVEADGNTFYPGRMGQDAPAEGEPDWDAYRLHVALIGSVHIGPHEDGRALDADESGHVERVMGVVRVFYIMGALSLGVAAVGLVVRMATGARDGGFTATTAVLGVLAVSFALLHFASGIPDGIDRQLEDRYGQGPEIAFITIDGGPEESDIWSDVQSGPMTGYVLAWLGTVAAAGGILVGHFAQVRRLGTRLVHEGPAPYGTTAVAGDTERRSTADTPAFKERLRKEVE